MSEKSWEKMPKVEKGVVIDHVSINRGPLVYLVLLPWLKKGVTANIRTNIPSKKLGNGENYGKKWVFKIEELIDDERFIENLALVGGKELTLNYIKNYEVVKKYHPKLPKVVKKGILECNNPYCVTKQDSHAGQRPEFILVKENPPIYKCKFCEEEIDQETIDKLVLEKGF